MLTTTLRKGPASSREAGIALVKTLIMAAAVLGLTVTGLVLTRSDGMISDNVVSGTKTLMIAAAGAEAGKNWLKAHLVSGPFPSPDLTLSLAEGSYTASVDYYTPGAIPSVGKYRITSSATGPNHALRTVEEVVAVPHFGESLSVVNVDGSATHSQLADCSGGTGCAIPDFSLDGRNHDETGALANGGANPPPPAACPAAVPVVAGTDTTPPTDFQNKVNALKCAIVQRANSVCNANGTGNGCVSALYWVRGSAPGNQYRYDGNASCDPGSASCCLNLDLSAPQLRATGLLSNASNPPLVALPSSANDRGPMTFDTPQDASDTPLTTTLSSAQSAALHATIDGILDNALSSPISSRQCIAGDLVGTTRTYGSWSSPKIVIAANPNAHDSRARALSTAPPCNGAGSNNNLDVRGGSVITGTGVLIVPREMTVKDATFHWQGLVVVLSDGDFRVVKAPGGPNQQQACGALFGAVLLEDDTGNDTKLDWSAAAPTTCANPFSTGSTTATSYGFSASYSCSAISRALGMLQRTLAWRERFGG